MANASAEPKVCEAEVGAAAVEALDGFDEAVVDDGTAAAAEEEWLRLESEMAGAGDTVRDFCAIAQTVVLYTLKIAVASASSSLSSVFRRARMVNGISS